MSRRTKLCITALFLVLLGIPAAYIALTWYPAQPLRFRLVHAYPESHRDQRGNRMLRISVQNPNPAPVYLFFVQLDLGRSIPDLQWFPPGYIDPSIQKESGLATSQDEFILPVDSTTHVTAFLHPPLVDEVLREGMIANYSCMSETHYRAALAYAWLRRHCPQSLQELLPAVQLPPLQTVPVEPVMK